MKFNRATVPQKVITLLFNDDSFYSNVTSNKKVTIQKFPRNDQWVDDDGLRMSFALAGYSSEDLKVSVTGGTLTIENKKRIDSNNAIQKGLIFRGIAKRNFCESIYVHEKFDVAKTEAEMKNGLLNVLIPFSEERELKEVTIK